MHALLAVDIRDESHTEVIERAAKWLEVMDAKADLIYVSELVSPDAYFTDLSVRQMVAEGWEQMRQDRVAQLRRSLEHLPEARRGIVRVLTGDAPVVLAEAAEAYDLVLLATHHRVGLKRFWLGSVAESLVRRCPVPVLVLPPLES